MVNEFLAAYTGWMLAMVVAAIIGAFIQSLRQDNHYRLTGQLLKEAREKLVDREEQIELLKSAARGEKIEHVHAKKATESLLRGAQSQLNDAQIAIGELEKDKANMLAEHNKLVEEHNAILASKAGPTVDTLTELLKHSIAEIEAERERNKTLSAAEQNWHEDRLALNNQIQSLKDNITSLQPVTNGTLAIISAEQYEALQSRANSLSGRVLQLESELAASINDHNMLLNQQRKVLFLVKTVSARMAVDADALKKCVE